MWTATVASGSVLTIEGTEPEFFQDRNGNDKQENATSKGYYYIGIQSYFP